MFLQIWIWTCLQKYEFKYIFYVLWIINNSTICDTKTHCVSSQFLLHVAIQRQSLCFYLFRKCCLYHLHEMLRSRNVLTKGTDSDNTAQQSLVMQTDGNLYPLFSVTVTMQFNSHRSDSDNLCHVCFLTVRYSWLRIFRR